MLFKLSSLSVAACTIALVTASLLTRGAEAGGGGCHASSPIADEAATTVRLVQNCFGPTVTRVDRGATVTFINDDPTPHTVTGAAMTWGNTANLLQGDTLQATFDDDGVYPYACILHPGMVGAVVVGSGGVVAASGGRVESSGVLAASNAIGETGSAPTEASSSTDMTDGSDGRSMAFAIGAIALIALIASAGVGFVMRLRASSSR